MNRGIGKILQVMQQLMAHFFGNVMTLLDSEL